MNEITEELEDKLNRLADNNNFFRSLWNQYNDKGRLSDKQIELIERTK